MSGPSSPAGTAKAVLILFDSLPLTSLGCYGGFRERTPGFDRLAARGAIFENALTPRVSGGASAFGADGPWSDSWNDARSRLEQGVAIREVCCTTPHALVDAVAPEAVQPWLESNETGLLAITAPELLSAPVHSHLAAIDEAIGRLFDLVSERPDRNTLLVVAALLSHPPGPDFPRLRAGAINVPLLLWSPALPEPGIRHSELVLVTDLLPTIARWLGRDLPDAGRDLLEPVRDDVEPGRVDVRTEGLGEVALRTGSHHLVMDAAALNDGAAHATGDRRVALFAKPGDAWDELDVGGTMPDVRRDLVERCDALTTSIASSVDSSSGQPAA